MSEPKRAPVDFFIKMHSALVAKNYSTALDFCKAILSFEQTNETMMTFHELLTKKINMMDEESDSTDSSRSKSSLSESDNDLI
ncbi:uncharacterized protein LOC115033734 isoform X2 [Acyrthosiphon pisum]|uniref:Uncharacterized protein n=1 Tax=Acyrthosiphon pisum TaxID=7029 RepID=A0A8R2JP66_ACYPI|nr:uncharacterized protein LOC115033734 isoform X2 [Acyrthosiphon pisum]